MKTSSLIFAILQQYSEYYSSLNYESQLVSPLYKHLQYSYFCCTSNLINTPAGPMNHNWYRCANRLINLFHHHCGIYIVTHEVGRHCAIYNYLRYCIIYIYLGYCAIYIYLRICT